VADPSTGGTALYCFDTSAFLDGWVRYYPPDTFPGLWENVAGMADAGELVSPDEVLTELEKKDDSILAWAKAHRAMFCPLDEPVQLATQRVLAQFPRLVNTQKGRDRADPFVIALAIVRGAVIVTGERNFGVPERPRIPLVCNHFRIEFIDFLQLIRRKSWQFR